MYFLTLHVDGDCSLSKSTDNNQSKIIISNIYNIYNDQNSLIAYSIGSTIMDNHSIDFKEIHFLKGKHVNMFTGTKTGHSIMKSIFETGGVPMYPFIAMNGGESYFIIHTNRESMMNNIHSIEKYNRLKFYDYIKIDSGDGIMDISRRLNREINFFDLTETEKKVIHEALNAGYLDWPRSISLDELAEKFAISKPTVLFHITNAERKILSCFISK
jgi:predicted DNA binding protein